MILTRKHPLVFLLVFGVWLLVFQITQVRPPNLRDKIQQSNFIKEIKELQDNGNLGENGDFKFVLQDGINNKIKGSQRRRRSHKKVDYSRKQYPLPVGDVTLNVAWFSMRTFWQERHYPILLSCKTGKVYLRKAERDLNAIKTADVVLFAGGFENDSLWRELQHQRDPSQFWLLNTDESPLTAKTHIPPSHLKNITFNLTFTYRSDADIYVPYGYYIKNSTNRKPKKPRVDYYNLHTKIAAWMSSHCDTIEWNRTGFIWDLSKYIPIDKYGTCGNMTCGNIDHYWERVVNLPCKKILREYRFLFALENSCCTEYISEKFWNILVNYDAIPVVIGAEKEDYERLAPPNSFIFAADFNSMKDLATYLKEVASNRELYNSFFKWKDEGFVQGAHVKQRRMGYTAANCRLLEYLQEHVPRYHRNVDLHGPSWLGGCSECGHSKLLRNHSSSGYNHIQE